jgi:L-alanine-DL-glutamate epimerase-like enolase superfamily enzyme
MRITAVETVRHKVHSNALWVRIETDEGIAGLGETFRHPVPVAAWVHDQLAPYLLGRDPRAVNRHHWEMTREGGLRFLGYPTRSVETRAVSAVDMALWDIRARAAGEPLCHHLGGPVRESIPVYNTCAGPGYNTHGGLVRARLGEDTPYDGAADADGVTDDLLWQHSDPGALARSLLEEGITAMKVWPFDAAAVRSGGHRIEHRDMAAALGKLAAIRDAVGDRMEILLEYHSLWHMAPMRRIVREVDAFRPFWHEDPVQMENFRDLAALRRATPTPIAGSESHGTAQWVRDALAHEALDYVHFDLGWIGGVTEGQRVAALALAHDRQIAPHDCTGPVTWIANLHLALAHVNALWLESVRAYARGAYRRMVTELPRVEGGHAHAMTGPGLGTELHPELLADPGTVVERSVP